MMIKPFAPYIGAFVGMLVGLAIYHVVLSKPIKRLSAESSYRECQRAISSQIGEVKFPDLPGSPNLSTAIGFIGTIQQERRNFSFTCLLQLEGSTWKVEQLIIKEMGIETETEAPANTDPLSLPLDPRSHATTTKNER